MINIAIDGPSGAGKSVLAKNLARELGFAYVDTGALYRAVGYYIYERGIDADDSAAVAAALDSVDIKLEYEGGTQLVLLNGADVSDKIRLPAISTYASKVSAIPQVRTMLLGIQRDAARDNNTVMDGRDIGTVILPGAAVKIFLSASLDNRAARRFEELTSKGIITTYEEVLFDMKQRDERDATRAESPCVPAADAVMLDNSGFMPEETLSAALAIIRDKIGDKNP